MTMQKVDLEHIESAREDDVSFEHCNCVHCRLGRVEKELFDLKKNTEPTS